MLPFQTAVDIANRALDHVGGDAIADFTENSLRASITGRVYDKLRQAELRRNVWTFARRKVVLRALDDNTRILAPALWVAGTTYFVGSIVADDNGTAWISVIPDNLGNDPQNSTAWQQYFGPMSVSLYDSSQSYYSGELVYTTPGDGTARVYLSLQTGNTDDPATPTAWSATAVYQKNQVATYSATPYMSRIDFNTNQTPSALTAAADWASSTTYAINDYATGSDGVTYQSTGNGNVGNDPISDGGVNWTSLDVLTPWQPSFVGGAGSLKWLQIGGTEFPNGVGLSGQNIVYPIGSGPWTQSSTANVYRLPAGFLRKAPTAPKDGLISILGVPGNPIADDWLFQGGYIISRQNGPIILSFVADTSDVRAMDPMFCEGLAARIGLSVCERLTQSADKIKVIAAAYEKFMTEARLTNSIETGAEEPPLDDWIATRA